MGCTSSAPSMVAANPKATEKIAQFREEEGPSIKGDNDVISAEEEIGKNEIKVLPSCDTLADPIQLDSNNKSIIETSNLDLEKDNFIDEIITGSVKENNKAKGIVVVEEIEQEEKMSSLEDVVEKVVELFAADNLIIDTPSEPEKADQIDDSIEPKAEPDPVPDQPQGPEEEQSAEITEQPLEEAISPSQSTSSRATRWEALADIAAELPPSHTVDPVTGQIYALSK